MGIRPRFTPGANALQIENGWRLEIPAGAAGFYRLAQLDDYASLPRSRFPHQPTTTLSLSCRVIGAAPTPGPPAPLASFAAAAIAGERPWPVGFQSMRFAIAGFIIPFMFIYGPAMVLNGTAWEIVQVIVTGLLGTLALAAAAQGWLLLRLNMVQRAVMLAGALALIKPGLVTDVIGFGILATFTIVQLIILKKQRAAPVTVI